MKSIILAAGEGTRLRPVTHMLPKCLARLTGVSLLDYHISVLHGAGIEDITLVGGYKSHRLEGRVPELQINPDYATTNMVHTLFCAEKMMVDGEDLIISYGDIVFHPEVIESLVKDDAPVSMVIDTDWRKYWAARMEDPLQDAETLKLDDEGNVLEVGKKPQSYQDIQGQYIGLIKVSGQWVKKFKDAYRDMDQSLEYDGKNFRNMYMTSFLQSLINRGWQVHSVPISNGWLETDSIEDLRTYHQLFLEQGLSTFFDLEKVVATIPTIGESHTLWKEAFDTITHLATGLPSPFSHADGFLVEEFIRDLAAEPLSLYSEATWQRLDALCKKIDVVGVVRASYTEDLSKKATDTYVSQPYLKAFTGILIFAAYAYEDLKFLNSALKMLDMIKGDKEISPLKEMAHKMLLRLAA